MSFEDSALAELASIEVAMQHLALVDGDTSDPEKSARDQLIEQLKTAPMHSFKVRSFVDKKIAEKPEIEGEKDIFPQYGLIGRRLATYGYGSDGIHEGTRLNNLVYTNTNSPWSTFICGSQGSGKSHTLSCMLENALLGPSKTGKLAEPLTGLVLHYDRFSGSETGQACEAAYLCSAGIPVRVLVSPSHYEAMKALYENLEGLPEGSPKPVVEKLKFSEEHLDITMMKTLMAVNSEGQEPLYMEIVTKILRDMAQGNGHSRIDYNSFKSALEGQGLVRNQRSSLNQRMALLEAFLEYQKTDIWAPRRSAAEASKISETVKKKWEFKPGSLTIIDLSCPFVGPNDACALFKICLSIFLKGRGSGNRLVALDEAHKFLATTNREAMELTENLLSIIRQQRHLGTRVIIATQEPAVSPKLLDLCDVTIVHRFTSPSWYKVLEGHLAGAVVGVSKDEQSKFDENNLFAKIVVLDRGVALVFCANGVLDVDGKEEEQDGGLPVRKLGPRYIKLKVRGRVTADGGRSILAKK